MEKIKAIKDSNTLTFLKLSKTLLNNVTTLLALLSLFGFIGTQDEVITNNSTNVTIITNETVMVTDDNTNDVNTFYAYLTISPLFFGFVRVINDFQNLCKYGKDIPNSASKGDYIGVFGEDLALICVEVIKGTSIHDNNIFTLISTIFKIFNYSITAFKIMFLIIVDGLKSGIGSDPEGAICLIKFLAFVGVSGFYVLYRYFTFTIDSEAGDMFALYALYNFIGLLHTYIYCTMICD
jgi:hypothetical protein